MMITRDRSLTASLCALVAGLACPAIAQDSVATLPGGNDALSAYNDQVVTYAVDLSEHVSTWGNSFFLAPLTKASLDPDPLFRSNLVGSTAISQSVIGPVSNDRSFAVWSEAGAGVSPTANEAPGSVSPQNFDGQFSVVVTDLNASASNVVIARVGIRSGVPNRLFVERIVAASSRADAGQSDTSTLAAGGVTAEAVATMRVDAFNTDATDAVAGDNIVSVDGVQRDDATVNTLFNPGSGNQAGDGAATTFTWEALTSPTTLPAVLPDGNSFVLDFDGGVRLGPLTGFLPFPSGARDRGNPSFASTDLFGGIGVAGTLGRSPQNVTDSINLYNFSEIPQLVTNAQGTATLPPTLSFGGLSASNAEFDQYLSQQAFRGPLGLVGVGVDPTRNVVLAAATARDPQAGQFVAVAAFSPSQDPAWEVVAWEGKPVQNGPSGAVIGAVGTGSPTAFSAPAVDSAGNIYFVGEFVPTGEAPRTGFFKAHRVAADQFELELILAEGDQYTGANSLTTATVETIALEDSDSIASGAFHGEQLLPDALPGRTLGQSAEPNAFGAAVLNVTLAYDRDGVPERYDVAMLILPESDAAVGPECPGDTNGDNVVDAVDFINVLVGFGGPGGSFLTGDFDLDGDVDADNFITALITFGSSCE
ncbi:MAG: hypothetical protein AAGI30_09155 [Planctomycetota bacterium]